MDKDIEREIEEILNLNGVYNGKRIGVASVNPQRDLIKICTILKKIRADIKLLEVKIDAKLEAHRKEIRKLKKDATV